MWHFARGEKQEGPVPEAELVSMLRAGILPPGTLVWREGMAEWQPASGVSSFWSSVGDVVQPAPGQPTYMPGPTNTLAITSLVLGIVSFVVGTLFLTAIPGVICGHMARRQIRDSGYPQSGNGMAITGLVLNYLALLLSVFLVIFFVWIFAFALTSGSGASPPHVTPGPVTPGPVAPGPVSPGPIPATPTIFVSF